MQLLILFILKILDCSISTLKTLFLIKSKNLYSSLANAISTFFYLVMLVHLTKNSSMIGILIICFATFIGTYLPTFIVNKLEKDNVWIFNITPNFNSDGKIIADILRENNLAVQTYKGYKNKKEILCVKAFAENKQESILLEQLIPSDCSYHIVELKGFNSHQ